MEKISDDTDESHELDVHLASVIFNQPPKPEAATAPDQRDVCTEISEIKK